VAGHAPRDTSRAWTHIGRRTERVSNDSMECSQWTWASNPSDRKKPVI
jgi:hypothetical protein